MTHASTPARTAAGAKDDEHEHTLADEVRELAEFLERAAGLALIAARGEEPERGAAYLVDTCADLYPRIRGLARDVMRHRSA